jgi:hypothetical protein
MLRELTLCTLPLHAKYVLTALIRLDLSFLWSVVLEAAWESNLSDREIGMMIPFVCF